MDAAVGTAATPAVGIDNSSVWLNFTAWTAQHLPYLNMTKLAPSIEDLVLAGPRMVMRLGRLGSYISIPYAVDNFGQRVIPEATAGGGAAGAVVDSSMLFAATTPPGSSSVVDAAAAAAESILAATASGPTVDQLVDQAAGGGAGAPSASRFTLEGARSIGSVFGYATSKWALCCIAMAVVLNRTHIFAATRRRLRLRWPVRLALRALPVFLFLVQARRLLQSIQCQTSPDFAAMRWGDASRSSDLMFSQASNFLHGLSSNLLLRPSDLQSCLAVRMVPPNPASPPAAGASDLRGSLALLWPLFGTFCLSQFLETVSCAVQGRTLAAETGMTLFEHSLAFAEADAAISNQLGWGLFTSSAPSAAAAASAATVPVLVNVAASASAGANIAITRSMIMKRANTPPEVLLVAFLSAMSHVVSHLLAIFNLQSRVRLASTGFFALCFMGSIVWSAVTFSMEDSAHQGLLRFPTVCIIGYIPHVLVLCGIVICGIIYALALVLSALSPPETRASPAGAAAAAAAETDVPPEEHTFMGRLRLAHANMQANISLSDIRITMEMDFYTALLRAGFGVITMASEAVYLNEDRRVNLKSYTWLEDERLREIEQLRMQWTPGPRYDSNGAIGLVPVVAAAAPSRQGQASGSFVAANGYARERAAQKVDKTRAGERGRPIRDGIGAAERSAKWLMALEYLMHTGRLMLRVWAAVACSVLARLGIANPPRLLGYLAQRPKRGGGAGGAGEANRTGVAAGNGGGAGVDGVRGARGQLVGEWLQGTTGHAYVPRKDTADVEQIVTNQLPGERDAGGVLYQWWLRGGWWGEVDGSSDYAPPTGEDGVDDPDFDTTSVISTATDVALPTDWESDVDNEEWEEGQRTPTPGSPLYAAARTMRESSPLLDSPLAMTDLARLLNPRSPGDHDEARAMAAHLGSDGIVTRSRYARMMAHERSQILLPPGSRARRSHPMQHVRQGSQRMTADEEAQLLEQILLSRREQAAAVASAEGSGATAETHGSSWATGGAGLGSDGPHCVVCQVAGRTIIVWPCRCLSLCDTCRVSLAMNNYDKCVCCRREVISFSRIFVP